MSRDVVRSPVLRQRWASDLEPWLDGGHLEWACGDAMDKQWHLRGFTTIRICASGKRVSGAIKLRRQNWCWLKGERIVGLPLMLRLMLCDLGSDDVWVWIEEG